MARRIPVVSRDELSAEHQAAYDEVAGIRGRAPVGGPSSVMIHSPEMAVRVKRLSEYLGDQSDLPENIKRLAAMIAARSMDCQFIWNADAAAGRRAGLNYALVDAIRDKKEIPATPSDESVVAKYGLKLTGTNKVLRCRPGTTQRTRARRVHDDHGLLPDVGHQRQRLHHRPTGSAY